MSYLRCNYRLTGKQIDIDAIGGGIALGSWGGGAGTNRAFGGFIMGSINANNSVITDSAYGAMSHYYGDGQFGSGYKVVPVAFQYLGGSVDYKVYTTMSFDGSVFALIPYKIYDIGSAASITTSMSVGDSISVALVWAGWVVSAP